MLCQSGQHRLFVVFADIGCYPAKECFAGGVFWHLADVVCCQLHRITTIGAEQTVAVLALRCAAVNDSHEIIGYDDAVLAFLLWVLGDDCLFYNLHVYNRCVSFYYLYASSYYLVVDL